MSATCPTCGAVLAARVAALSDLQLAEILDEAIQSMTPNATLRAALLAALQGEKP